MILVQTFLISAITCYSGGVVTANGNKCVNTFTINGSFNVTSDIPNAEMLIIGGGGAGGSYFGGGGGAGGLIYNNSYSLSSGNYNIVIGLGGNARGINGGNSSFDSLIAIGGGNGGIGGGSTSPIANNGGSGGGGGATTSIRFGALGILGQGYNGGDSLGTGGNYTTGGGGGSSQIGFNSTSLNSGNGGDGTLINITGTPTYYAGGGGGSSGKFAISGIGGLGGGGNGGKIDTGSGAWFSDGTNGTDGTGGGGGGGIIDGVGGENYAYSGGSGIIIISYNSVPAIEFVSPTDENGDSYQRQNILVNVTSDINNITIYFYNSTQNLVANFSSTSSPFFYNYSTGIDGTFYFNATSCNDLVCSSTETRFVNLDSFNPIIDIFYPIEEGFYNYNVNTINFTVLNTGTIDTCLVSINGAINISVPNCTEGITMAYSGFNSTEGNNTITVWANDTVGLSGSHTHIYTIDTIPPTIDIIFPINTTYLSRTQILNISSNGNTILYNFDGTNHTYISPIFVIFNEGFNDLEVYALDNAGNFNSTNILFTVNTPPPPAYLSNSIYQIISSSGAGLGMFIIFIAKALPLLLIGLAFVGILVVIGMAIKKYLVDGGSP